jgi:nitrite reductase/ring-hydroxylating ferredoxin subunit
MRPGVPYESIPNGWFAVARSGEIRRGKLIERKYFGRDWVLWRSSSGRIAMQDTYCPHLGANLADGCVKGEHLRCPFHGFEFSASGECMKTAYGKRPPARARLEGLPLLERDGLVFAWFHAQDEAPTWEPPCFEAAGFTGFRFLERSFRGHPQEVSENSSDLGHFGPVHSYAKAERIGESSIEGHLLKARYRVMRSLDFIGIPNASAELDFAAEVHGLGYSTVHAKVEQVGIDVRLLVLPTPIDESHIDLRLGVRMKRLPIPGLTPLVHRFLLHAYVGDVDLDIPIWKRKVYVKRPALAEGDGPIGAYRRYASQFYSQPRVALPILGASRDAAE